MNKPKDKRPKPKFQLNQHFDYPTREEVFRVIERFWSPLSKRWMYTVVYPHRPAPTNRLQIITKAKDGSEYNKNGQFRRYDEDRLTEECKKFKDNRAAKLLF